MRTARGRRWLGLLFAAGAGIAIAWVDSRPGFDAVGSTVITLILAAWLAVLIGDIRSVAVAMLTGLLVGIWVPLLELSGSSGAASLAAVAFALAGALGGVAMVRLRSGGLPVH